MMSDQEITETGLSRMLYMGLIRSEEIQWISVREIPFKSISGWPDRDAGTSDG